VVDGDFQAVSPTRRLTLAKRPSNIKTVIDGLPHGNMMGHSVAFALQATTAKRESSEYGQFET
jgi:hypothetical protein